MTSTNEPRGFEMANLRTRTEREIRALATDCLAQVCKAKPVPGQEDPWKPHQMARMLDLIEAADLTEPVPNPCVGNEHNEHDIRTVISIVCDVAGYTKAELVGTRGSHDIIRARHLMFLVIKDFCQHKSYPQIGRVVERDHTTVLYGVKRARQRLTKDPGFKDLYQRIANRLAYEA